MCNGDGFNAGSQTPIIGCDFDTIIAFVNERIYGHMRGSLKTTYNRLRTIATDNRKKSWKSLDTCPVTVSIWDSRTTQFDRGDFDHVQNPAGYHTGHWWSFVCLNSRATVVLQCCG